MHLHLVLPGLLWPSIHARGFASALALPALSRLLGRADCRPLAGETPEQTWARLFGIDAATLADAPLRRWGEADAWHDGTDLLCADPTHLHFAGEYLLLTDARELAIGRDEADALIDALNTEFADIGRFDAPRPTAGTCIRARRPRPRCHACRPSPGDRSCTTCRAMATP